MIKNFNREGSAPLSPLEITPGYIPGHIFIHIRVRKLTFIESHSQPVLIKSITCCSPVGELDLDDEIEFDLEW